MKRFFGVITAAFFGSTVGYVGHQFMHAQKSPDGKISPDALVVGAPVVTAGIATLVGLLFGKRGRFVAFLTGAAIAGTMGDKLDAMVPGLAEAKQKMLDKGGAKA